MTKQTNVFLHYFPHEGFYKVTSSTKEAHAFVEGSKWVDEYVQLVWSTMFPTTFEAESFKFSILAGLNKYKPTSEPSIKSSRTTYKGDPIDLDTAMAGDAAKPMDEEKIYLYLLKFAGTDAEFYKIGYSKDDPALGNYSDNIVWRAVVTGRAMAEAVTGFVMRECCAQRLSVQGYTFRQAFIPSCDVSSAKIVRELYEAWVKSGAAQTQQAKPPTKIIEPAEEF